MLHQTNALPRLEVTDLMPRKVSELNEVHPLDCLIAAQVRTEWAAFTWYYDHGYIRYYDGAKALLREHQYVAQAAYGVPDGYYVHHRDSNRLNNQADNLTVMSPSDHGRLHASQLKAERVELVCPVCGSEFVTTRSRVEQRNKTYCSLECLGIANRKVERPSRERLAGLLSEIGNWSELGRMFGVSDNAVRKWARAYGLL
jgi:hypothetical protein